jgi:hypothetical protein
MLGGLLSAHYLSSQLPDASSPEDHVYLSKAIDLANRLLGPYESKSGILYATLQASTYGTELAFPHTEMARLRRQLKLLRYN